MIRKILSAALLATSLTSFLIAGFASIATADDPPNPNVFCDFYQVPNDPKTYCGGVCPFEGQFCALLAQNVPNPPPAQCVCLDVFEPIDP